MSAVFEARYGGRCATECGTPIHEGDQVTYADDELIHADCVDRPEPKQPPVCQSCWLTHAGECF